MKLQVLMLFSKKKEFKYCTGQMAFVLSPGEGYQTQWSLTKWNSINQTEHGDWWRKSNDKSSRNERKCNYKGRL